MIGLMINDFQGNAEVSATDRSLVQRNPTECVCVCVCATECYRAQK